MKTLVVISHPRPDSLSHAAADRVRRGLATARDEVRVIDLDREAFDPRMSRVEKLDYGRSIPEDLAKHVDALRWAERIILVYPTWFSGQPARLKGWFDRVWIPGVAFDPPKHGGTRIRGRLRNIKKLEIVTTHGSGKLMNMAQVQSGKRVVFRSLRMLCHPLCRTRFTPLYNLDRLERPEIEAWLEFIEKRFSK
jgi:NAD(P)H dehydrogenase (quinone)